MAHKIVQGGLPKVKPEAILSAEINPRNRTETDKAFLRSCEDLMNLQWEDLTAWVQPERVMIPAKVYEKPGDDGDD